MSNLIAFVQAHEVGLLSAGLALSEALALIPGVQGNSILQSVINGLQSLLNKINGPKV